MSKIIFYGGSFDPVHNGHLSVVRQLQAKFKAKVLVVPASNWMKSSGLLDLADRITITKKALEYEKDVEVVDWSLHWNNMEFTSEMIKQYKEKYPECKAKLYLAIGADTLENLPGWYNVGELAKHVTLIVIGRPGYKIDKQVIRDLKFKMHSLKSVGDISSSEIRSKRLPWRTYVPGNVWHLLKNKLD